MDVGRPCARLEIMTAAERGPHKSALDLDAIEMMYAEVEANAMDGFAELIYLDEIEHLLESEEWAHLKISPIAMVPHKSRKYRAILDLSFSLKVFGMEIPSVNENATFTVPQHSMQQLGNALPQLIESVARAPTHISSICVGAQ